MQMPVLNRLNRYSCTYVHHWTKGYQLSRHNWSILVAHNNTYIVQWKPKHTLIDSFGQFHRVKNVIWTHLALGRDQRDSDRLTLGLNQGELSSLPLVPAALPRLEEVPRALNQLGCIDGAQILTTEDCEVTHAKRHRIRPTMQGVLL